MNLMDFQSAPGQQRILEEIARAKQLTSELRNMFGHLRDEHRALKVRVEGLESMQLRLHSHEL